MTLAEVTIITLLLINAGLIGTRIIQRRAARRLDAQRMKETIAMCNRMANLFKDKNP